jgi:hypothetical protein
MYSKRSSMKIVRRRVAIALGSEGPNGKPEPVMPAEREQLVCVALADARLLPTPQRKFVLGGREVSEEVLNAYHLAEFKLQKW